MGPKSTYSPTALGRRQRFFAFSQYKARKVRFVCVLCEVKVWSVWSKRDRFGAAKGSTFSRRNE